MGLFYREGHLHFGTEAQSVDLTLLREKEGTPLFVYDLSGMQTEIEKFKAALQGRAHIHYAVKANSHPELLRHFAQWGLGADVVSAGEAQIALDAGIPAEQIIFSGVAKTVREIEFALTKGLEQINVESPQELERIGKIARRLGKVAPVAFRMNPDVDAKTHPYITTGFKENKFGMSEYFIPQLDQILKEYSGAIDLRGLTIHIGSQLRDNTCFSEAIEKTLPVLRHFREQGHDMRVFDVGGGVGVDYQKGAVDDEQVRDYGRIVLAALKGADVEIYCEPGRVFTACHGVLLTEVQYVKESPDKNFLIVDTGMHHLMRPSLYQAYHRVLPLFEDPQSENKTYDIVGPICESTDFLAKDRELASLNQGDWIAIAESGAYARSMASQYNAHDFPKEKICYQGQWL